MTELVENIDENENKYVHPAPENSASQKMHDFVDHFMSEIYSMKLKESDFDKTLKLVTELLNIVHDTNKNLIEESNGLNPLDAIDMTNATICSTLSSFNSSFKRKSKYVSNRFFVAPKEMSIGTRIETVKNDDNIVIPTRVQNKFPYISIIETLTSEFKNEKFADAYFRYNSDNHDSHKCEPNVYKYFSRLTHFKN